MDETRRKGRRVARTRAAAAQGGSFSRHNTSKASRDRSSHHVSSPFNCDDMILYIDEDAGVYSRATPHSSRYSIYADIPTPRTPRKTGDEKTTIADR